MSAHTQPHLPTIYVELVGAELCETHGPKVYYFIFGEEIQHTAKSKSKIIDNRLYVLQWVAHANRVRWRGEFIPGTRSTKMQAINRTFLDDTMEAARLMHVASTLQQQADVMRQQAQSLLDKHVNPNTHTDDED